MQPTLTWRSMTADDLPALVDLIAACEAEDNTGEHLDLAHVTEIYEDPTLDRDRDLLVVDAGDRLVAHAHVSGRTLAPRTDQVSLVGGVHPQWRRHGLGAELLSWSLRRAGQLHAERHPEVPGEAEVRCPDRNEGASALYTSAGLRPVRYWCDMARDLSGPVPVPEEVAITPFDPARDDEVRRAHNETFAEHWGSGERDQETWEHLFTGARAFRPALSGVVLDRGEVAAYLLGYFYEADTAVTGVRDAYVGQLGTRPDCRGRGYASALLAWFLDVAHSRGYDRASLGVDADNATGALGLYQRLGFEVTDRWTSWVATL